VAKVITDFQKRNELHSFYQYCILKGIVKFTYCAKKYEAPEFYEKIKRKTDKIDLRNTAKGDKIITLKTIKIEEFEIWAGLKAEFYQDERRKSIALKKVEEAVKVEKKWKFGDNFKKLVSKIEEKIDGEDPYQNLPHYATITFHQID
jgi:hypothetical protein